MGRERILFVDDDPAIREVVSVLLSGEEYEVITASSGEEFFQKLDDSFDLAILDIMLPGMDGFSICRQLREQYSMPVLFLTAKSMDTDKINGFSAGADDYLVKPFTYNDLILKVKSLLRRYNVYGSKTTLQEESLTVSEHLTIFPKSLQVFYDEEEISLTDTEYNILYLLASHKKTVFSSKEIYETIWKEQYYDFSHNTVMVHLRNLRKKIRDDSTTHQVIINIWGKGYRID